MAEALKSLKAPNRAIEVLVIVPHAAQQSVTQRLLSALEDRAHVSRSTLHVLTGARANREVRFVSPARVPAAVVCS